jgi:F0F1-type ATP synthase delta subunit
MPLDTAEQDKVKRELTGAGSVSFKVDPAILGGLVIRSGDRVVDGSVRSNLGSAASRLN